MLLSIVLNLWNIFKQKVGHWLGTSNKVHCHGVNYGKCFYSIINNFFREEQLKNGLPSKRLAQDVPTRWSSTYDMLNSIFNNRIAICSALMFSKHADLLLTPYEWEIVEVLIKFLFPFKVCTNFFQTDKQISLSAIYPLLHRLRKDYTLELDDDPNVIRGIKKSMAGILQQMINEYKGEFILAATFLDPR